MRRASAALAANLLAVCAAPATAGPAVLEARVVGEDGAPLREEWVWVFWDRGAPVRFEEGTRRALNPKARTSVDGKLSIEIPEGFFEPGDVLALAWERRLEGKSRFTALHGRDGKRLTFRLADLHREEGLGTLIAPAPKPD